MRLCWPRAANRRPLRERRRSGRWSTTSRGRRARTFSRRISHSTFCRRSTARCATAKNVIDCNVSLPCGSSRDGSATTSFTPPPLNRKPWVFPGTGDGQRPSLHRRRPGKPRLYLAILLELSIWITRTSKQERGLRFHFAPRRVEPSDVISRSYPGRVPHIVGAQSPHPADHVRNCLGSGLDRPDGGRWRGPSRRPGQAS